MKVCIMKDNRSSVYEEEGKPYQTLQEASKQKSSLSAENRQQKLLMILKMAVLGPVGRERERGGCNTEANSFSRSI